MLTTRDLLMIYGPDQLAYGITRGLIEVDRVTGRLGLAPFRRPSFWVNTGLTLGGALAALKLRAPWDKLLGLIGGYVSTEYWKYIEEMVGGLRLRLPAARARLALPMQSPSAPSVTIDKKYEVSTPGRYLVTG